MHKQLGHFAVDNGVTMSEIVRSIVADWFKEHPVVDTEKEKEAAVKMTVVFGKQHYAFLDAKAKAEGVPVSALLRALLKQKLSDVDLHNDGGALI